MNSKEEKVEVLISTINKENLDFLEEMNISSDVVIGNQNGKVNVIEKFVDEKRRFMICSDTKGISANRNITINNAKNSICILADDDIEYVDNYEKLILEAFMVNKDASIIIFNVFEKPILRYVIKKQFIVNRFNYMRFGSVRIAFKLDDILTNNILFDENFGTGSKYNCGEDTIFLHDCIKKKLKIVAVPIFLVKLRNERESTWFFGYNETYFHNKGALFARIYNKTYFAIIVLYSIKHVKITKEVGFFNSLLCMLKGAKAYLSNKNTK